jgi:hypothetical protein
MWILLNKGMAVIGPRAWNRYIFQEALKDDLDLIYDLPTNPEPYQVIEIDADTKIMYVIYQDPPQYDGRFERLDGPYFNFNPDHVEAYYTVGEIPVDAARNFCKGECTDIRYIIETQGLTMTIQDQTVTVDTARGGRDIFLQTYATMEEGDTVNWKFPQCWLTLTKSELGHIVSEGRAHIQNCFNWEKTKHDALDAATDAATMKAIMEDARTVLPVQDAANFRLPKGTVIE